MRHTDFKSSKKSPDFLKMFSDFSDFFGFFRIFLDFFGFFWVNENFFRIFRIFFLVNEDFINKKNLNTVFEELFTPK